MAATGDSDSKSKTRARPTRPGNQVRLLNILRSGSPSKQMERKLAFEEEQFQRRQKGGPGLDTDSGSLDDTAPSVPRVPPRPRTRAPRVTANPQSTLKTDFGTPQIDQLRKDCDRGGFKGVGDFGKVLDMAKALHDRKVDSPEKQMLILKGIVKTASEYLDKRPGPTDNTPRVFKDGIEKSKIEGATRLLQQARLMQQDLIHARFATDLNGPDRKKREQAVGGHAKELAEAFGTRRPAGGTSEVELIKNAAGGVAYAFKSVDGESDQTHMAKGSGAVREVAASLFNETVQQQSGLDFGFPRVDMVSVKGRKGAMVEGLKGKPLDGEALMKAMQDGTITAEDYIAEKQAFAKMADRVPAKQLQKMLLCNLAMAQFDIKWENLMIDDSQGEPVLQPFDAGAAFPPKQMVKDTIKRGAEPGAVLLMNPGSGQMLAAASAPMDDELVQQFLAIDANAVGTALKKERQRLATEHGMDPALLGDDETERSLESIRQIQQLLTANPKQTMDEFVQAYAKLLPQLAG